MNESSHMREAGLPATRYGLRPPAATPAPDRAPLVELLTSLDNLSLTMHRAVMDLYAEYARGQMLRAELVEQVAALHARYAVARGDAIRTASGPPS